VAIIVASHGNYRGIYRGLYGAVHRDIAGIFVV
jgi:hypothetical protein